MGADTDIYTHHHFVLSFIQLVSKRLTPLLPNYLNSLWPNFSKVLETFLTDFERYWHDSITRLLQIYRPGIARFTNSDLLNRDLVILEATAVQWAYCHTQVGCIVWTICHWFWGAHSLARRYKAGWIHVFLSEFCPPDCRSWNPDSSDQQGFSNLQLPNFGVLVGILASLLRWQKGHRCGLLLL